MQPIRSFHSRSSVFIYFLHVDLLHQCVVNFDMPRICYGLRQDGRHDVGGGNFWGMIQHWLAACAVLAGILIACSFAATRLFFAAIRLAVSFAIESFASLTLEVVFVSLQKPTILMY